MQVGRAWRTGTGQSAQDQRDVARRGLYQDPFGHLIAAFDMHAPQAAGFILMRERPLQKLTTPPQ